MSGRLAGRVAIVTGASSGIGKAIAERLGSLGAHVHLIGRTERPMQASAGRIEAAGGTASVEVLDVRDLSALGATIAAITERHGGLHVMVNNAGLGHPGGIVDGDPEQWREMLEVNVLAVATGCRAAVRAMRASKSEGHIVNISSTAVFRTDNGIYGATKHAVNAINATLREELQDDPIRSVSIMPGVFSTNFPRHFDPADLEGLGAAIGVEVDVDEHGHMSDETIGTIQQRMSPMIGDVARIADVVEFVVTQPVEIHIDQIVIRPPKTLDV